MQKHILRSEWRRLELCEGVLLLITTLQYVLIPILFQGSGREDITGVWSYP
jgi:hypothetical protein